MLEYPGTLYIVAAPSGGGKTSLVKKLIQLIDKIEISISHTTRPIRPGEVHGVDYFFVDEPAFMDLLAKNAFIEHAMVFDAYYGTSIVQIEERLKQGIDVILDIDWQGAQQIRNKFVNSVSIFIVPPSLSILEKRLTARQQDHHTVIADRMKRAQDELRHFSEFDYLIVNDHFDVAAFELQSIVTANRLRLKQQVVKHEKLLSFLLS